MIKPHNIEYMKEVAQKRGGECLSFEYKNNQTHLTWKCGTCGHEWLATPSNILRGKWCRICRVGVPHTFENFERIAKEYGGQCLGIEKVGRYFKIELECKAGHRWVSDASSVKSGHWCRLCSIANRFGKSLDGSTTYNLEFFDNYAKQYQGKALSLQINKPFNKSRINFECNKGHQWETNPAAVTNNAWCHKCRFDLYSIDYNNQTNFVCPAKHMTQIKASRAKNLERVCGIANQKKGKCLSDQYINNRTKLLFRCERGHKWEAPPASIFSGYWCTKCGQINRQRLWTDEKYREYATQKGGRLIEIEPPDLKQGRQSQTRKITFECSKGHQWITITGSVHQNSWCKICSTNNRSEKSHLELLSKIQQLARCRNGDIISQSPMGRKNVVEVICNKHGKFKSTPARLLIGKWCPKCKSERLREVFRTPYEKVKVACEVRGWTLLTSEAEYLNSRSQKVMCSNGHVSIKNYHKILSGQSCGTCFQKRGEAMCRVTLENIFGAPFPKERPNWLVGSKGARLELDGYNRELKLGFEYQGIQHSEANHFNHDKNAFKALQKRDQLKKELCKKHDVKLVIISEFPDKDFYNGRVIIGHIKRALETCNVKYPLYFNEEFDPVQLTNQSKELAILQIKALEKKQLLLSSVYKGRKHKYRWKCMQCGKERTAMIGSLNHIGGCIECSRRNSWAKRNANKIDVLKKHAELRGGSCLSMAYISNSTKYKWCCEKGHEWEATWSNISHSANPTWCPICGNRKKGLYKKKHVDIP